MQSEVVLTRAAVNVFKQATGFAVVEVVCIPTTSAVMTTTKAPRRTRRQCEVNVLGSYGIDAARSAGTWQTQIGGRQRQRLYRAKNWRVELVKAGCCN